MTVVDYLLVLPSDYFEGPPADWLRFLKQPKCRVVDLADGYMSCIGDGAQPEFEIALFCHRDGRPLLAVCQGELEWPNSVYLDFFEMGADGAAPFFPSPMRVTTKGIGDSNYRETAGRFWCAIRRVEKSADAHLERRKVSGREMRIFISIHAFWANPCC